jgi:uncharacterized membrane protein
VTPQPAPHPHHPRHRLRNLLFAGLLILVPVYFTFYVLQLLFRAMDGVFAPVIDRAVGRFLPGFHLPGLGILLTLLVVLVLGWLSTNVVGRRLLTAFETVIRRIPIAKSIYGATKGVMEAVSRDQAEAFKRVVVIEYPRPGLWGLGFVTGAPADWSDDDPRLAQLVPVFVPTTPNPTSGYLLLVPVDEISECPLTVEEGIRMVVSGGILLPDPEVLRSRRTLPAGAAGAATGASPPAAPRAVGAGR